MDITLIPTTPNGTLKAISSKSVAHRLLICAAFAEGNTKILCENTNKDIDATVSCLIALGADITYDAPYFTVKPIKVPTNGASLPCGESGSTLRFLLPLIPALGIDASFLMEGRLPERPLSPLYEELVAHGASLSEAGSNPLSAGGYLDGGEYKIRGDVSSQFISGLLFALCISGIGGKISISGELESAAYIDMTFDALNTFGAGLQKTESGYTVPAGARLIPPETLQVEGDWSGAAFALCMGAISGGTVTVTGLREDSRQGDREIVRILRRFGADIRSEGDSFTVYGGKQLRGISINASQIPDLVPVLAVVASFALGETKIHGASRLRLKESDRLESTSRLLSTLGGQVTELGDGLLISGQEKLYGGSVNCYNDHRIAMSAAVASVGCEHEVVIRDAECVAKSYPDFWNDIKNCLGVVEKA